LRVTPLSFGDGMTKWDLAIGVAVAPSYSYEPNVRHALIRGDDLVDGGLRSGDGKRVVTASRNNTARIWGGEETAVLKGHGGPVTHERRDVL